MLIYEVNLTVDTDVAAAFADWLSPHIHEVVRVGKFLSARWCERDSATDDENEKQLWTIHYTVPDRACLDAYLTHHAPRLREDGQQRFGGHFTATRRVLTIREEVR